MFVIVTAPVFNVRGFIMDVTQKRASDGRNLTIDLCYIICIFSNTFIYF